VDDVLTTGGSTLKAIDRLKAHGCTILMVLALVDRHEGGTEAITSRGYPVEAIFTLNDFMGLMKPRKKRKPRG
jgi:orotate phosphoribosyltransferase